jgi:hypothetical protein
LQTKYKHGEGKAKRDEWERKSRLDEGKVVGKTKQRKE